MKTSIIHFSDIHIKSDSDVIFQRKDALAKACNAAVAGSTRVIVVVTGDLAFSGKDEEYNLVYDLLKYVENFIKASNFVNPYEYVMIPGNHDCDFSKIDSVVKTVRDNVRKSGNVEDANMAACCLNPQRAFWQLYSKLRGENIEPFISCTYTSILKSDLSIHFNCYNTAFLSEINETPGSLLIPEKYFIELSPKKRNEDFVISIFHHNTSWLSPNTNSNNRRRFEQHLLKTSNIVMSGHEHEGEQKKTLDLSMNTEIIYFDGFALQNGEDSSFSVYVFDSTENRLYVTNYCYSVDYYSEIEEKEVTLKSKNMDGLFLSDYFSDALNKIEAPIKHPAKDPLFLSDVFVWQDLESIGDSKEQYLQYEDSRAVLTKQSLKGVVYIEGDSQSGKTALLRMTYQTFISKGIYPILLNGKDITHPNVKDLLRQEYRKQYRYSNYPYDKYLQIDKDKIIVMIDDLNNCRLNNDGISAMFVNLFSVFKTIIVMSTMQTDVKSYLLHKRDDIEIRRYRLSSLGYLKRDELIRKWIRIGKDKFSYDEDTINDEIKLTFDQISNIIGEQLIPTFPIFILSLLQSLNLALQRFDVSQTSYAICYNSLILASLCQSGVAADRMEGVINFLKELSYYLYSVGKKSFTENEFQKFYSDYSLKYITTFTSDDLMGKFKMSNIFKTDDAEISFSYRYLYYYLVATKISNIEDSEFIDSTVDRLCSSIHEEESANILIFLVNTIGKKQSVIDSLLLTSMLPYENCPEATLYRDDPLFKDITGLINEIKHEVIYKNTNPEEERKKALKRSDEIQRRAELEQPDNTNIADPAIRDLNNALKIIRILGQIVKNQNETFERDRLVNIIEETYKVSFRTISFLTQMIDDTKEDFVQFFLDENKKIKKYDDNEIKERVTKLLQFILYRFSLQIFSNLAFSVGSRGMESIYNEVATRINSPAAKIVTFTIKSYYNRMKLKDLIDIVNEFNDNPVALEIIKARVIRYVYHNRVDVSTRQKIGSICHLKLVNNALIEGHSSKHNEN